MARPTRSPSRTDAALLDGVQELLDAGTRYYTAVQAIIPLAASTEVHVHAVTTRRSCAGRASPPARRRSSLGFDSVPIRAEKSLYDLAMWTEVARGARRGRARRPGRRRGGRAVRRHADEWRARFQAHLDRFGHATYNLDFVHPTPVDDPAPLFEALRFALDGGARAPTSGRRRPCAGGRS